MIQALLTFLSLVVVDYFWAIYIKAMADDHTLRGSFFSMGIMLTGGLAVISYTENHWMLIPAAFGCFAGTYLSKHLTIEKITEQYYKIIKGQYEKVHDTKEDIDRNDRGSIAASMDRKSKCLMYLRDAQRILKAEGWLVDPHTDYVWRVGDYSAIISSCENCDCGDKAKYYVCISQKDAVTQGPTCEDPAALRNALAQVRFFTEHTK